MLSILFTDTKLLPQITIITGLIFICMLFILRSFFVAAVADLAWGGWSQWNPSCSDLLCNSTTLHNSTSKGPCVWMGEEEGLFSNVSGNIIVQTRRRMQDDCTAERCPECEGEEQTRVGML